MAGTELAWWSVWASRGRDARISGSWFHVPLFSVCVKFGGVVAGRALWCGADCAALPPLSPVGIGSAMVERQTDCASAQLAQKRSEAGIASLEEIFTRHKSVARKVLANENARLMETRIYDALNRVAGLLERIGAEPPAGKALRDELLSQGEMLSSDMLAAVLCEHGVVAQQVDPRHCILTNDEYGCAIPSMPETFAQTERHLSSLIDSRIVPVLGGFIGATANGTTTTLGRGGSDYTAALIRTNRSSLNLDHVTR